VRVPWIDLPSHYRWLAIEEDRLVLLHETSSRGSPFGYTPVDRQGRADFASVRLLYAVARQAHCFSLEHLRGRPGAKVLAETALDALNGCFYDDLEGGWFASVAADGQVVSTTKEAYGHAFLLLAATSGMQASCRGAREMFEKVDTVLDEHFWREDEGAVVDAFTADWRLLEPSYRGQNANMHLTEAYLAAFEATGEEKFLRRAERISDLIVNRNGAAFGWRLPEHFDSSWRVLADYNADRPDDQLRPPGCLVGHWLEWSRLLIQLSTLNGSQIPWAQDASVQLFAAAIRDGWDESGNGFIYSVDLEGKPLVQDRIHWVMAEAVGAAVFLSRATSEESYGQWYEEFWSFIEMKVIDRSSGSWWHQLDSGSTPVFTVWDGKPDLYHALQATLYARSDPRFGLVEAARRGLQQ